MIKMNVKVLFLGLVMFVAMFSIPVSAQASNAQQSDFLNFITALLGGDASEGSWWDTFLGWFSLPGADLTCEEMGYYHSAYSCAA